MPAGLVKLMIHASGQISCTSFTMSKITGMVRSPLNNPPAPLVSGLVAVAQRDALIFFTRLQLAHAQLGGDEICAQLRGDPAF